MWFMKEPSQFSMGQTAQSLICSIVEKQHTELDDCVNMLPSCFRKRMSGETARQTVRRPLDFDLTSAERVNEPAGQSDDSDDATAAFKRCTSGMRISATKALSALTIFR